METEKLWASKIKMMLRHKDIATNELAKRITKSRGFLYRSLSTSKDMDLDTLSEIGLALGKDVSWFLIEELGPDEDVDDLLANRKANLANEKTELAKRILELEGLLAEEKSLHEWSLKECALLNQQIETKDKLIGLLEMQLEAGRKAG